MSDTLCRIAKPFATQELFGKILQPEVSENVIHQLVIRKRI